MNKDDWHELTFEEDPHKVATEFKKKYQGCTLFLAPPGEEPTLCTFDSNWQQNDGPIMFRFYTEKHGAVDIAFNTLSNLYVAWPTVGLFTVPDKGEMFIFSRIPARQYMKAISDRNCCLHGVVVPTTKLPLKYPFIRAAFEGNHLPFKEAVAKVKGEAISQSINSKFGVSCAPSDDKKILLWYYNTAIGVVEESSITPLYPKVFDQELQDFLRDNTI